MKFRNNAMLLEQKISKTKQFLSRKITKKQLRIVIRGEFQHMVKHSSSFRFLTLSLMILIFIDLMEPIHGEEDSMVIEANG